MTDQTAKPLDKRQRFGRNNSFYGKRHTEKFKKHMHDIKIGKKFVDLVGEEKASIWKSKISANLHTRKHTEEFKINLRNRMKGNTIWVGRHHTPETKLKLSLMRSGKNNPMYGSTLPKWKLQKMMKCRQSRPTKLERRYISLLAFYNLPFIYTGNGEHFVGTKCPDFIHKEGRKIAIEVRHTKVCERIYHESFDTYSRKRKIYFTKQGWYCLIFSEKHLHQPQMIINTVKGNLL